MRSKYSSTDPETNKLKVQALLTAFQGSLFSHMISVSNSRNESQSYLGHIPYPIEIAPMDFQDLNRSTPVDFHDISRHSSIKTTQYKEIFRKSPVENPNDTRISSRSSQFKEINMVINSKSNKQSHQNSHMSSGMNSVLKEISLEQISDEDFVTSFGQASEPSPTSKRSSKNDNKISSVKIDIGDYLLRCRGLRKQIMKEKEEFEFEFEENDPTVPERLAKVLQRKNVQPNNIENLDMKPKPARFIVPEDLPAHIQNAPKPVSNTLYGEVISTTYSQGGDGFALHPGDLVTILQFLTDFGLAECRWQGMQGLFPQDKIRVLTKPDQSFNSSLVTLAQRQLFNVSKPENSFQTPSKLLSRITKSK